MKFVTKLLICILSIAAFSTSIQAQTVSTFASGFNNPVCTVFDGAGNLYVSNRGDGTISKVTTGGIVSTYASGLNSPTGLAFDALGNLYVGSSSGITVSKISLGGVVSTFASGISNAAGLAFDASGNLYVNNVNSNIINKVTPGGVVSTLVSSGLSSPYGITFDATTGNLFVANLAGGTISKVTLAGVVSTFATGLSNQPTGIIADGTGAFYVLQRSTNTLNKISSSGVVSTIGTSLALSNPQLLALDASGSLYVPNFNGNTVSKITLPPSTYTAINNGNWNTPATWQGGVVPPAGSDVIIAANVSIDVANVTVGNLTINTGFTLTGVFTNSITMNSGKTFTNNGTLTGTLGSTLYTFIFAGSGLVAGSSLTNFATVQINGAVDFGTTSSVQNLTINAGGSVNINRPTYTIGSSLNYNTGGTYIIGDEWVTGNTNYPRALTINAGTTLSFGNITTSRRVGGVNDAININGGLILSSAAGGDLIITSTYTNFNGTFTANGRTVTCLDGGSNCIIGGSLPVTFDNLVLNLPGKQFNLFTRVGVRTSATFTAGYTQINNNDLVFFSGATITGASANCYVYTTGAGRLVMSNVGAGPVVVPIGRNIGNNFIHYNPVTITNGGNFDYAIKANATAPTGAGILDATKVIRCQWDITPSGNATNVGLNFQYINGQGVTGGTFSEIAPQRGLRYNTSTSAWETIGTATPVGTNPYNVSYTFSGPTWGLFSFESVTPPPTITTTGTLSAFTGCAGTVSASQSFTTSGTNLTANLVVTPPTGYEVSTTAGSGYASSLNLTPTSGTVASTTIFVRLASTATGTPAGNITVASTSATTQNVAVTGTVNALPLAIITPTGPTTFCPGAQVGLNAPPYALQFNGANYVSVANGYAATDDITYEATVTPSAFSGGGFNVIINHNNYNTGALHYQFSPTGVLQFAISGNVVVGAPDAYCSFTFVPGTTYRLATVYSKAAKYTKFYVNGVLINTVTYSTAVSILGNNSYSIGCWNSNGVNSRFFQGTIDDVRIWNVIRTDAQVLSDAAAAFIPTGTANLVRYYRFDEGTGTTTSDDAGGATGILVNNPLWVSSAPVGQTYLWSNSSTTQNINVTTGGSYTVTVTNPSGCTATSTATVVTVNSTLANNTITAAQIICSGSTPIQLNGSIPTGGNGSFTYLWQRSTTSATAGFSAALNTNTNSNYQPTSLTQTTWFRRVVTSGVCNGDTSAAIIITVNALVSNNTVTADQTICSGSTPNSLTGSTPTGGDGSTYTYLWQRSTTSATSGFSAALNTNTNSNYQPTSLTQTTWFRRVVTSGVCNGDTSAAVMITVNSLVSNNTITSAQTICSGSTPNSLTGSTPTGGDGTTYTYLWQRSTTSATAGFSAALNTNTNSNYLPTSLTQPTWFRRVVTSGVCNGDTSAAVMITVTVPVTTNTITAAQTICTASTPASLTGSTPTGGDGTIYTYLWQRSTTSATAGFTAALNTNTTINYQPTSLTQTTWFRRVVTSGVCNGDTSAAVMITVNALVTNNTITAAQTICTASTPAQLTGSTPAGGTGTFTYLWQRSTTSATAGFSAALNVNTTINYQPTSLTQTTWFRRVVTSGVCNGDTSASVMITVNALVTTNTITAAQTICTASTPAQLTGSTPAGGTGTFTYLWQRSTTSATAGFTAALNVNTTINYQPTSLTQTTWFRRVVTSGVCNGDTSTAVMITVTVPVTTNTITAAQTICTASTPAQLNGSTPAGGTGTFAYLWQRSTTSATAGFTAALNVNTTINYQPTSLTQTTWFRRVVTSGACNGDTSTAVMITVNALVTTNTITAAQSICTGSTPAQLNGSTPTGGIGTYAYLWQRSTTSATAGFSAALNVNTTINYQPTSLTQTTWFRRVVTSGVCNGDTSAAVMITVNSLPVASISSASTILCGPTATLNLIATGGTSYQWSIGGTPIVGATAATYTANAIGTYTATATNAQGCTAPATGSIVLTRLIAAIPAFNFDSYCINTAINFTNQTVTTGAGTVSYAWSDNIGNSATTTNTSITYANTGSYNVKLRVQSTVCTNLADSITRTVVVESVLPATRYTTVDAAINDDTQLQARNFGTSYTWIPSTGLNNAFTRTPIANITQQQQYRIAIRVPSGCVTVDTVLVRVHENYTVYVPNVFTPNGDGRNDKVIILPVGITQLRSFRIYNRWNKKVYETSDINGGWDGRVNGVLQPMETYVWFVEAIAKDGSLVSKTGSITLLR